MRKVMLLAAMLAMALIAASPAFAQATGGDVSVQYVDCSQVAAVAAAQGQYGDATATSGDIGSAAAAEISNQLGISIEQVNACLGGVAAGGDIVVEDDAVEKDVVEKDVVEDEVVKEDVAEEKVVEEEAAAPAAAPAAEAEAPAVVASAGAAPAAAPTAAPAAPTQTLPDTGGVSVVSLVAGVVLVAGGLLARRIVR
jgi:hypothetical protein